MSKKETAKQWVIGQFNAGHGVYLFEVADFFSTISTNGFTSARKLMESLVTSTDATEDTEDANRPHYIAGSNFLRVSGTSFTQTNK